MGKGPTQWLGRCQDLQNTSCPQGGTSHFPWKVSIMGYSQASQQTVVRTKNASAQHPGDSAQWVPSTSGNAMERFAFFSSLSTNCLNSRSVMKITFILVFDGDFYFNRRHRGKGDVWSAGQVMARKQEDPLSSEPQHPHEKCEVLTSVSSSTHLQPECPGCGAGLFSELLVWA